MAVIKDLYPPIMDTIIPAFDIESDTFKIYFKLSDFNSDSQISNVQISIYDSIKNISVVKNSSNIIFIPTPVNENGINDLSSWYDKEKNQYYVTIHNSDLNESFIADRPYKVQIRFGGNNSAFSEENEKARYRNNLNKLTSAYQNEISPYLTTISTSGDGDSTSIVSSIIEYKMPSEIVNSKYGYLSIYNYQKYLKEKIDIKQNIEDSFLINSLVGLNNYTIGEDNEIVIRNANEEINPDEEAPEEDYEEDDISSQAEDDDTPINNFDPVKNAKAVMGGFNEDGSEKENFKEERQCFFYLEKIEEGKYDVYTYYPTLITQENERIILAFTQPEKINGVIVDSECYILVDGERQQIKDDSSLALAVSAFRYQQDKANKLYVYNSKKKNKYSGYSIQDLNNIHVQVANQYYQNASTLFTDILGKGVISFISKYTLDPNEELQKLIEGFNADYPYSDLDSDTRTEEEKELDFVEKSLTGGFYDQESKTWKITPKYLNAALAYVDKRIKDKDKEIISDAIARAKHQLKIDMEQYRATLQELLSSGVKYEYDEEKDTYTEIKQIGYKASNSYLEFVRSKNQEIARKIAQYNNIHSQYYGGPILPTGNSSADNIVYDYHGNIVISTTDYCNPTSATLSQDGTINTITIAQTAKGKKKTYSIHKAAQEKGLNSLIKGDSWVKDYTLLENDSAKINIYGRLGNFNDVPAPIETIFAAESSADEILSAYERDKIFQEAQDHYLNRQLKDKSITGFVDSSTGSYYFGWYFDEFDSLEDQYQSKENSSYISTGIFKDNKTKFSFSYNKTLADSINDTSFMAQVHKYLKGYDSEDGAKIEDATSFKSIAEVITTMYNNTGILIQDKHRLKASKYLTALSKKEKDTSSVEEKAYLPSSVVIKMKDDGAVEKLNAEGSPVTIGKKKYWLFDEIPFAEYTESEAFTFDNKKDPKTLSKIPTYYSSANIRPSKYTIPNESSKDLIVENSENIIRPYYDENKNQVVSPTQKYSLLDGQIDYSDIIGTDIKCDIGFIEKICVGSYGKGTPCEVVLNNFKAKSTIFKSALDTYSNHINAYQKALKAKQKEIDTAIKNKESAIANSAVGKKYNNIISQINNAFQAYQAEVDGLRDLYRDSYSPYLSRYEDLMDAASEIQNVYNEEISKTLSYTHIDDSDSATLDAYNDYIDMLNLFFAIESEKAKEFGGEVVLENSDNTSLPSIKYIEKPTLSVKETYEFNKNKKDIENKYIALFDNFLSLLSANANEVDSTQSFNTASEYINALNKIIDELVIDTTTSNPSTSWYSYYLDSFSEWSTVTIVKPISPISVSIEDFKLVNDLPNNNLVSLVFFERIPQFTATWQQEEISQGGIAEELQSYSFTIKDVETDENVLPPEITYVKYGEQPNYCNYACNFNFEENKDYQVTFSIVTKNLYEKSISNIFQMANSENDELPFDITMYGDKDEGRIDFTIIPSLSAIDGFSQYTIQRSCKEEKYKQWDDVLNYSFKSGTDPVHIYDYSIESDKTYKYRIVSNDDYHNLIADILTADGESEIYCSFSYTYLVANNTQLNIKFNNKLSSFKFVTSETKFEPVDSQYPFITKNGKLFYRTFPLSCMISISADENKIFFNNEDIKHLDSYAQERAFREQVYNFLYKNKYFLFKSATEGNIIIKLTDISFTPQENLDRLIYTMNATANECYQYNADNIKELNIQTLEPFAEVDTSTDLFFDSYNDFTDFEHNIDVLDLLKESKEPITNIRSDIKDFFFVTEDGLYQRIKKTSNLNLNIYLKENDEVVGSPFLTILYTPSDGSEQETFYRTYNATTEDMARRFISLTFDDFDLLNTSLIIQDTDEFEIDEIRASFNYDFITYDDSILEKKVAATSSTRYVQIISCTTDNLKEYLLNRYTRTMKIGDFTVNIIPTIDYIKIIGGGTSIELTDFEVGVEDVTVYAYLHEYKEYKLKIEI